VWSLEVSERFLWDLRQTAQELVVENDALRLKELGQRDRFQLSIEPHDMTPCADMTLGTAAEYRLRSTSVQMLAASSSRSEVLPRAASSTGRPWSGLNRNDRSDHRPSGLRSLFDDDLIGEKPGSVSGAGVAVRADAAHQEVLMTARTSPEYFS
jgi:hypothetical protein